MHYAFTGGSDGANPQAVDLAFDSAGSSVVGYSEVILQRSQRRLGVGEIAKSYMIPAERLLRGLGVSWPVPQHLRQVGGNLDRPDCRLSRLAVQHSPLRQRLLTNGSPLA